MSEQTYPCPSPDNCEFVAEDATDLLEHVNAEHAGEFQRPDWPDTPAGRAGREPDQGDVDGDE